MSKISEVTDVCDTTPWDDLLSYLPADWELKAYELKVMKGARQDKNLSNTLRTLFMHLGVGCSLKESALRAKLAGLCNISSVALYGRLKKFGPLFQYLCAEFFEENRTAALTDSTRIRLIDATDIQEPGDTGSKWRFHYSFTMPIMLCDFTKLSPTKGKGTGETFKQFPIEQGDLIIGDRAYSNANGIVHVKQCGGEVCVRHNPQALPLYVKNGKPFNVKNHIKSITRPGQAKEWECWIKNTENGSMFQGRICVIRKTVEQIAAAHKKLKRLAIKKGRILMDLTLLYNEYVIIVTTFDKEKFPLRKILDIYRWRWQVELVFKRFKSLLELGHLPKTTDESSRAWLYGKLLIAFLIEKISARNGAFSPWRDNSEKEHEREPLDDLRLYIAFDSALDSPFARHNRNSYA
jgi:hypothetical protein